MPRSGHAELALPPGYRPAGEQTAHLAMHARGGERSASGAGSPRVRALTRSAISATAHCLTGCPIGEILGMAFAN
jgi:hypothetical protein